MAEERFFDVFLAHSSKDKTLIRQIYQKLKERNLRPWLDEEEIPPGTSFQDEIQQAITQIKAAAICIGQGGLGPWQAIELKAFISQCVNRKIPVIPVLLPGVAEIPENLLFLREFNAVAFNQDLEDEQVFYRLEWGITRKKPQSRTVLKSAISQRRLGEEVLPSEKAENIEQLHQALLRLGYWEQVRVFRKFIESQSIAAFLIHGKPEYGQRWLLNRLILRQLHGSITAKVVPVVLSRHGRKISVSTLWREMAGRLQLGRNSTPKEIVERVYGWWQTQHVLLIVQDVEHLTQAALDEFIRDFWQPLTTQAKNTSSRNNQFHLLMFLIDFSGSVGKWKLSFVEQLEPSWQPSVPIKLPLINLFSNKELVGWLNCEMDELPIQLTDKADETAQIVLKNSSNGIPEPALQEICYLANCDWYEQEKKWLKY